MLEMSSIYPILRAVRAVVKKYYDAAKNVQFKTHFAEGCVRSPKNITFSENRPAGDSFHVMGKQVHTIIAHVCVSDVEIMWDKVPWVLREVSL